MKPDICQPADACLNCFWPSIALSLWVAICFILFLWVYGKLLVAERAGNRKLAWKWFVVALIGGVLFLASLFGFSTLFGGAS